MNPETNVKLVLRYFEACNSGDLDDLRSTLAPDVVHYFLSELHPAIRGADHLARYWRKFRQIYNPTWRVDHTLACGNEVVSEWSCAYTPKNSAKRMMFRGTEWYVISEDLIHEVRAYYQYQEDRDCELISFPYRERGYLLK
jgi:ketosteroid isomerase-like protein